MNIGMIPKPFGLTNPNVLCYFNSMIQALLACSKSNQFVLKYKDGNEMWVKYRNMVVNAFDINDSNRPTNVIDLITCLKSYLQKSQQLQQVAITVPLFGSGQEDAGEGLHLFIDAMKQPEYTKLFENQYVHDMYCKSCKVIVSSPIDKSIQVEIPYNYCKSRHKWDDDNDVEYTGELNMYLRHHITQVSNYKCPNCKKTVDAYRVSHLIKAPSIFVVVFNKFIESQKWITELPTTLKFPCESKTKQTAQYNIIAKIEHSGNGNGGHYVCNALRRNGTGTSCYMFNDSSVSAGSFNPSANTYICIYTLLRK